MHVAAFEECVCVCVCVCVCACVCVCGGGGGGVCVYTSVVCVCVRTPAPPPSSTHTYHPPTPSPTRHMHACRLEALPNAGGCAAQALKECKLQQAAPTHSSAGTSVSSHNQPSPGLQPPPPFSSSQSHPLLDTRLNHPHPTTPSSQGLTAAGLAAEGLCGAQPAPELQHLSGPGTAAEQVRVQDGAGSTLLPECPPLILTLL
jgi:hypothetical protein